MMSGLFQTTTDKRLLSIFYTAGYPKLDSTLEIAAKLEEAGVDFLEIGFPYSDPVADGPIIQQSSQVALKNGMNLKILFKQLENLRTSVKIPVYLMGYFNPVLQYGVEKFCQSCQEAGINGVIIPDLPLYEFEDLYKDIFHNYGIEMIFLITPQTSEERIRKIDALSTSFIYLLSSASTTGNKLDLGESTEKYFSRIKDLNLKSTLVVGFGISNQASFKMATDYAQGAIIGSAFVKEMGQTVPDLTHFQNFIKDIRG